MSINIYHLFKELKNHRFCRTNDCLWATKRLFYRPGSKFQPVTAPYIWFKFLARLMCTYYSWARTYDGSLTNMYGMDGLRVCPTALSAPRSTPDSVTVIYCHACAFMQSNVKFVGPYYLHITVWYCYVKNCISAWKRKLRLLYTHITLCTYHIINNLIIIIYILKA